MTATRIPYVPLGAFYFFYFAVIGGFMPYWGLYLQSLGFDAAAIGELAAVAMATRIIAPNFWGYVADRTGQRLRLVRLGAFMVMAGWLGVYFARTFWPMAAVLLVYGFFQNAILAQFEAVTIAHLGTRRERYSQVRLWGSLGFIATVTGLGVLFDHVSVGWLPTAMLLCALATWLSGLTVPDIATRRRHETTTGFWEILRREPVWTLFVADFLLQLSHAPYYTFYSIFLSEHGYSRTEIGWLWGLGVLAEVVMFIFMRRILPAVGEQRLMYWSLALAAVRWLVIGTCVDHRALIWAAQLLHAATFATFHAAAMSRIYDHFGDGHQGQGQAVYSMTWGVGAALGSWVAGCFWSPAHAAAIYAAASVLCVLGWWLLRPRTRCVQPAR